jgi:hypothetical protein
MFGKIIIFKLGKELTAAERARFCRELYGYVDRSNHGKYIYERRGLLSSIPHFIPAKSVIVVRREDAEKVESFLRERNARVFAWTIDLADREIGKMK